MSQPTTPAPAGQPAAPEKPRTAWEKVITSTPIILTVVATILAGLSSGEMTRAQYHRALAAQNQSKVSDQWNFFQAKRIRGTNMEGTAALLRSVTGAGKLSPESLQAAAARLSEQIERADKEGEALAKAVDAAGSAADALRPAAERFRADAKAALPARVKLAQALGQTEARQPLTYLTSGTVPERVEYTPEQRKELDAALDRIDAGRARRSTTSTRSCSRASTTSTRRSRWRCGKSTNARPNGRWKARSSGSPLSRSTRPSMTGRTWLGNTRTWATRTRKPFAASTS